MFLCILFLIKFDYEWTVYYFYKSVLKGKPVNDAATVPFIPS